MNDAVVTGAGSGIGRAFALEIARRGGRVVCADIGLAGAKETVQVIEECGGAALAVECDVSVEAQVVALAERAEEWLGGAVGLVVNNAGIGAGGQVVGETPLEDWRRTLGVNLWGVVHGCHVFAPRLGEGGGIINVASAASFAAAPRMAPYNVSKAGVLALSETLAAEGVRVTVLCPTFVKTNIVAAGLIDERTARLGERVMKWTGFSPGRVARIALDAHEKGRLYVLPQLDARVLWRLKRAAPVAYTRALGLIARIGG
ncbi:SDR family NAD(P)-dependent oxidoreductase [Actinomadura barringtoniae]|uniref:SDR family NAD(P)-dependent oxidoreductase n=1 Tax=Actinomadura barringtoniae TaxID=1427535 RepID=A0A939PKL1_9ACTN|nr:SDR family NAD(P)-dependent oxidoreductase [Actinomadura barringtoniae]MBO2451803.1 SDR family NAD(P)-dependent oxidoreductase [Actinomadura barringtoniae]